MLTDMRYCNDTYAVSMILSQYYSQWEQVHWIHHKKHESIDRIAYTFSMELASKWKWTSVLAQRSVFSLHEWLSIIRDNYSN